MYDFLDRPVASLNVGGRVLVWATRQWVLSAAAGRCPCSDVGPAFHHWGLLAGLSQFQLMMVTLARHSREKMTFCDPACTCIGESEALLLELFCTMRERGDAAFCQTAALVVHDRAVTPLATAVAALGRALESREIYPERVQRDDVLRDAWRGKSTGS
jgi:hypothetical protein